MNSIHIHFGSDQDFNKHITSIGNYTSIMDVFNHIGKIDYVIKGYTYEEDPLEIENLVLFTDDYGSIREWALLSFSNNMLGNNKVNIKNVWMNNPPKKIYDDVIRNYPKNIIRELQSTYQSVSIEMLKEMAANFDSEVMGQDSVIKNLLASLYSLRSPNRKKPVTILFLGESGVGKTETAKYISSFLGGEMLRVQFSMQQTNEAYQYIFGAKHGQDSLARDLIRRESNIVLFDEFDKVPLSLHNAFYQLFDEGTYVDGNYLVNMEKCIIICTTNYSSEVEAERKLGTPIYSRFSKIVKFHPISIDNKIRIAQRNYNYFFEQLEKEDQELIQNNRVLSFYTEMISKGYYKNIRMLRNDIEEAINFEILKARGIIAID